MENRGIIRARHADVRNVYDVDSLLSQYVEGRNADVLVEQEAKLQPLLPSSRSTRALSAMAPEMSSGNRTAYASA